jgi:DNA-binding beta-propeller fold protein YncE
MTEGIRGRACLAVLGVLAIVGMIPDAATAAACPGANPCPYVGTPTVFGSYGVSYLNAQAGVTVDGDGNQYLTDWNNSRVISYTSTGAFRWAVGANNASGASGSGPDQFDHPYELRAVGDGSTGKLYVADGRNNRIEELNTLDGSFVRSWSGDGHTAFSLPVGLAIDPTSGNVYVADYNNNRVEEFSPSGTFIEAFGWGVATGASAFETCTSSCLAGLSGSGVGQFKAPIGVAVDATGDVYVADSGNNRIERFGPAPTFTPGAATSGVLNQPYGLAIDGAGNLWVADAGNNRLVKWGTSSWPTFLETYGWGVADGANHSETCTSSCSGGHSGLGDGEFSFPEDVAVDPITTNIHVADNGNSREQQLDSSGNYVSSIVSPEFPNNELRLNCEDRVVPSGDGNLWISDTCNSRVVKVTPSGTILVRIGANNGDGAAASGAGQLSSPYGLAVDSSGNLYVADAGNNRIDKFTSSGAFLETIGWGVTDGAQQLEVCSTSCRGGIAGQGDGQFWGDQGVALDSSGNIYVGDTQNCRVQKLSPSGSYIARWGRVGGNGSCGAGPGQFSSPVSVTIDAGGNVWVADYNNSNIQEFTQGGAYLATVGGPGTIGGTFDGPQQVSFDPAGDMLVADSSNARAQLLDPATGTFGFAWGYPPAGASPLPGEIGSAGGVTPFGANQVVVTDQTDDQVEVFTFAAPSVSAPAATPSATHAALAGTVDPNGGAAAYQFQWGPTSAYGALTPFGGTGPSTSSQSVGATISGLRSETTYHWRLVASNPAGMAATSDQQFTTTPFGTGPMGPQGTTGQHGSTGQQGHTGPTGAQGPPGGAPSVTCSGKLKKGKVTVTCKLALKLPARDHVWIRLSRRGRLYATAHLVTKRAGLRRVALQMLKAPPHGAYKLTVLIAPPHSRANVFSWTVNL